MIHEAVRKGVLANELTPVYMGSAYKNKGVQLLLDAVMRYLPAPTDIDNTAIKMLPGGEEEEFVFDIWRCGVIAVLWRPVGYPPRGA